MMTEQRDPEQPLFRALNPGALLVAAVGAAFCFSFVRNIASSCLCLALSCLLAAVRGRSVLPLLKRLAVVNVFVGFIWLTVPLTSPGEIVASLGPLTWSREGIDLALLATVKCNAILLAFLVFVSGISPLHIGCALERIRMPAKLVFLFFFTYRYIHVVGEEWRRLWTAAALRGFVPRNSLHTYRTVGNMLGLTVINAVDRSRRIYEAMLLRGFNGTFNTVTELRGTRADVLFVAAFFLVLGALLLFDRGFSI